MENYRVTGNWKGKEIDEDVSAPSDKFAKFIVGKQLGLSNSETGEFARSNKIRVSRR